MHKSVPAVGCLFILMAVVPGQVEAQSGSRRSAVVRRADRQLALAQPAPAATGAPAANAFVKPRADLALGGNDAVQLLSSGELAAGDASIASVYQGQTYRFMNADNKGKFDEEQHLYLPCLAGDSPVALKDEARIVAGDPKFHSVYGMEQKRIFLFASEAEKLRFDADPQRYYDVDLVLNGFSPVSLVNDELLRRGNAEFEIVYDGRRIRLYSEEEKTAFNKDAARYYPAFGGIDPVGIVGGNPQLGVPKFSVLYKNRLFVHVNAANRDEFMKHPDKYSELDLADGGVCPVTKLERPQEKPVPGHYGTSAIYRGQRFLFASEEARLKFISAPDKYVPAKK